MPSRQTALNSPNLFTYNMLDHGARMHDEVEVSVPADGDVAIEERLRNIRVVEFQRFDRPLPVPTLSLRILSESAEEHDGKEVWVEPTRVPLIRDEEEFLRKFSRLLQTPRLGAGYQSEAAVERLERVIHRTSGG